MKIVQSRLEGVPGGIVESDAIQFASRKVAAVSGDARRALDICRRAVEIADNDNADSQSILSTPTKFGSSLSKASSLGKVNINTIKRAINEATSSPLQQHLKGLPLSSKLLLAALVARFRRTGLTESVLGEIVEEAQRIAKMAVTIDILQNLVTDISPTYVAGKVLLHSRKAPRVLALGTAAIELMEAGIIGMETKKGDRMGKIRLCIGEEDVKQAFRSDIEVKGLGLL